MAESSGWTLETLHEHWTTLRDADRQAVATALNAAEKAVAAAMAASEKAILKAEAAADRRAEASNEIRQAMMDQQRQFATVQQVDTLKEQLEKLEKVVNDKVSKSAGGMQLWQIMGAIILSVGAIFAMIALFNGGAQ